jgi:hypothetical protein
MPSNLQLVRKGSEMLLLQTSDFLWEAEALRWRPARGRRYRSESWRQTQTRGIRKVRRRFVVEAKVHDWTMPKLTNRSSTSSIHTHKRRGMIKWSRNLSKMQCESTKTSDWRNTADYSNSIVLAEAKSLFKVSVTSKKQPWNNLEVLQNSTYSLNYHNIDQTKF